MFMRMVKAGGQRRLMLCSAVWRFKVLSALVASTSVYE